MIRPLRDHVMIVETPRYPPDGAAIQTALVKAMVATSNSLEARRHTDALRAQVDQVTARLAHLEAPAPRPGHRPVSRSRSPPTTATGAWTPPMRRG